VIFFRERRRHDNLKNNFFNKRFAVLPFPIFKTLDKRKPPGRNFALMAEAEDINTGTGTER
jgi:hypothetical protein